MEIRSLHLKEINREYKWPQTSRSLDLNLVRHKTRAQDERGHSPPVLGHQLTQHEGHILTVLLGGAEDQTGVLGDHLRDQSQ